MADDLERALEAARRGDEWGLTSLYQALNPAVVRYLRNQAGQAADDLTADTWLGAVRGLARFEGTSADFRIWLFTVARRRLIDHRRRQSRRPPLVALHEVGEPPAPLDVAETVLADMTAEAALQQLVAHLSPEQAEVVVLRVVGGLSAEEVARVTGRTPGAVRVLQHRALRRVRETIGWVVTT